MAHAVRNLCHRQLLLLAQKAEQTVLRKRDISAAELLRESNDEGPLERSKDVGEPLGIVAQARFFAGIRHKLRAFILNSAKDQSTSRL
jgi:hypothetical protein